jgi:catechol 2,3-dioxygenase-like lactoylglutathione lyase family enzyme
MNRFSVVLILAVSVATLAPRLSAQLLNKEAPVIVSHYHLNVTSVAEHKKFWVDTLGGTSMKFGKDEAIKFPDVYLFLHEKKPTGPTHGTAFDHIGFSAPDVPALTTKVVANGYQLTQGREPKPGEKVALPTAGNYGRLAYILGPDGAKIEVVTNMAPDAPPIKHHHVHFINKQYVEMRQWYEKALNATMRTGPNTFTDFFTGADLPGVGYMLNFFRWEGDQSITHQPTAGRVYDHVGFEVTNLEAFSKELEGKGFTLTKKYGTNGDMNNIMTASLVDPWGVSIELTEGLRKLQ